MNPMGAKMPSNLAWPSQRYASMLWFLLALFFLRVLGQLLVAIFAPHYLPPMEEWYSGLIPYPILFPVQLLILVVMLKVSADFSRGQGFFVVQRKAMGHCLIWISTLYFTSMVLRYGITMALHPERRWFGGTIPIWFHFVLAGFLYALGHFHYRR